MKFGWNLSDGEMKKLMRILLKVTQKDCQNKERQEAKQLLSIFNNNLSQLTLEANKK